MRTLLRWAARLYPARWRDRYGDEFAALLEDISPSFADLWNVLGGAVRVRLTTSMDAYLVPAPVSPVTSRLPVMASLSAHGLMIGLVLLAIGGQVNTMPLGVVAPLPPRVPDPPPQVTDARVFPNAATLYSSLPLKMPTPRNTLPLYVDDGVGIKFLALPDIGAEYRQGNAEWRVWPGQALENFIIRRALPEYPRGTNSRGAVSVFVEYLITGDGSVKVLRSSGPEPFRGAAQSAIEHWVYGPLEYENHPCEVVSRVEVRFDGDLARSGVWR
jgi:Gram-negative bacterial TonB protein C-terminal